MKTSKEVSDMCELQQKVDALQQQVNVLAAENSNQRHLLDMVAEIGNANFGKTSLKTPATDAAIRELQAQGVEILTRRLQALIDEGCFDAKESGVAAGTVHEGAQIAAQLRNEGGV